MAQASQALAGIILAGGLARRMGGGDKCLLTLGDKTLLQHTIERATPQLAALALNANGDPLRFALSGLPIVVDHFANHMGPLAGIHAGLKWMRETTAHQWLASFPCDTPFFPLDLLEKLFAQTGGGVNLVVARANQQTHSVFALWHSSLLEKIAEQLASGKVPRLQDWIDQQNTAYVDFSSDSDDSFFNINTPDNLIAAEAILERQIKERLC
ncbi:MAG TPA: molybdenum cofactor guanylyltransferase MobA [Cellvibrio sp.]|nr:molybdenum cofactor guanylyltransferase MobA [Cellvibrio sp.]